MSAPNSVGDIREVYTLVQSVRVDVLAEIDKLAAQTDKRLSDMKTEWGHKLALHENEHRSDRDNRSSLVRWTVTTVLSSAVGLSGWVAFVVAIID